MTPQYFSRQSHKKKKKKAIQFERYCRGGRPDNLAERIQIGTNLSDSKPQQTGHIHIKCDGGRLGNLNLSPK